MKKRKPGKKLVIGLTGSFGTGKSTVAKMFKSFGCRVIDADRISRDLLKPGREVYRRVIRVFGKAIVGKNGRIERRKLAGMVFSDKRVLDRFNRLIHPEIIRQIKLQVKSAGEEVVVLDAPLLMEKNLDRLADAVVVVKASLINQIKRIKKRSGLSKSEITARISSQSPLKEKLGKADFVIDNNGTIENTRKQVALIRRLWWRS